MLAVLLPAARAAGNFNSAYLSEVVVDNRRGLTDEDGDRSGWVELHNGGHRPVNLAGWFLSNDRAHPARWRFPEVVLLPGKQIIVFVSGKDRLRDLNRLHANFRFDPKKAGGTVVVLFDAATNLVSELVVPSPGPPADQAYGSARGEPELRGRLARPTPGKPNPSSGDGFAPAVTFSQPGGTFQNTLRLELASKIPATAGSDSTPGTGMVIRYTRDGTMPNQRSPIYSNSSPLELTNTAYIRARAYQGGLLPGPPAGAAYLKLFSDVTQYSSDLPLLVIETFGRHEEVSARTSLAHLSFFEPVNGRSSLTNSPTLTVRAGHRVRGSTSAGMPQPGFALEFVDEFNAERPMAPLGLPADADWILYAPNAYDPVLIHNPFVHQLSRDLGRYSPRTRFVEVFIVSGAGRIHETHYEGLYVLEEKIKIGRDRVNVDRLGADDLTPPGVTGGYLFKFDRLGPEEGGVFFEGDRGMVYVEPREQTMLLPQRAAQRKYVKDYFTDFERVLQGPDWKDPGQGYRAYLDVDAAIDFHVVEVLSGNVDALVLSTYFHKPRNGRITFGPHWDFDRALGSTDGRDDDPRIWTTGPFFSGAWWPRLFSDPDFWQQWIDRWQALRRTHFATQNLNALIDRQAAELREAQPRQYRRWGFQPRGGSYRAELDHMKEWLSNRVDFIDGQLVPPPSFAWSKDSSSTNLLHFTTPTNVTVYYTLDGSDPRRPQGGISSNAIAYVSSIPLESNQRLTARARNLRRRQRGGPPVSSPWSGPVVIAPEGDAPPKRE
jgi:hypothetical protein